MEVRGDVIRIVSDTHSQIAASTDTVFAQEYSKGSRKQARHARRNRTRSGCRKEVIPKTPSILTPTIRPNPSGRNRTSDQLISENTGHSIQHYSQSLYQLSYTRLSALDIALVTKLDSQASTRTITHPTLHCTSFQPCHVFYLSSPRIN